MNYMIGELIRVTDEECKSCMGKLGEFDTDTGYIVLQCMECNRRPIYDPDTEMRNDE